MGGMGIQGSTYSVGEFMGVRGAAVIGGGWRSLGGVGVCRFGSGIGMLRGRSLFSGFFVVSSFGSVGVTGGLLWRASIRSSSVGGLGLLGMGAGGRL